MPSIRVGVEGRSDGTGRRPRPSTQQHIARAGALAPAAQAEPRTDALILGAQLSLDRYRIRNGRAEHFRDLS